MLAPALTEMAMIDGLPDNPIPNGYGYGTYGRPRPSSRVTSPMTKKSVLNRAGQLGFERLLVLDCDTSGHPVIAEWHAKGARVVPLSLTGLTTHRPAR